MERVIVDTDFLNHILKVKNGEEILEKIISFYNYQPIMHPWVYKREIQGLNSRIENWVENHVTIMDYSDFMTEDDDSIYTYLLEDIYHQMNKEELNLQNQDFRTYNKSGKNLGEIHSVILAHFTGIPLLLSDDYNAKEIAAKRVNTDNYTLTVKKSFELLCDIAEKDKTIISLDSAIEIIRSYKGNRNKELIREITKIYKTQ